MRPQIRMSPRRSVSRSPRGSVRRWPHSTDSRTGGCSRTRPPRPMPSSAFGANSPDRPRDRGRRAMFNHAAAAREDVEDARRGHPAVTLEAYAVERGLDYRNQELAGHFGGLNPQFPNYVFNSMRGTLAPGRFGTLQHELLEVNLGSDGSPSVGQWYGRRTVTWNGVRGML